MDYEKQLKLQAYLDGELPEGEANELAARLQQDPEATALLTELRQTRQAMAGAEEALRLPETREFYWSKIQREIQRLETPVSRPAPASAWLAGLRRFLVPVTGLALLVVAGFIATRGPGEQISSIDTAVADPGALVYHDYSAGATFVWLPYPADNEVAEADDESILD